MHVTKPIANFGVAVLSGHAVPHVVFDGDENHLVGFTGLPDGAQPVPRDRSARRGPVAGAVLPAPGTYEIVFDTRTAAGRAVHVPLLGERHDAAAGSASLSTSGDDLVSISDGGAGVDPDSMRASLDGHSTSSATGTAGSRSRPRARAATC